MLKAEARKYYLKEREKIAAKDSIRLDDLALIQFQQLPLPYIESVLSYWPAESLHEINTHLFTAFLEFRYPGLLVMYPRTETNNNSMEAIVPAGDDHFKKNRYGIYEPVEGTLMDPKNIDLIIVPMIICDKKGNRVGYGKGYYDRFLKRCSHDCLKIGLSYFEPLEQITDAAEFDVPLDICITPKSTYVF